MTIDCALVQAAGPPAPPAMPGGEPRTDAAAFAAVIDPLLAADATAGPSDSGGAADPTLAAFAEASIVPLDVAPAGDRSPTPPAVAEEEAQSDDAVPDESPDPSAAMPVALVVPVAAPALPVLPVPLAGSPADSGVDGGADAITDLAPIGRGPAAPAMIAAEAPPAASRTESSSVTPANPASEDAAAAPAGRQQDPSAAPVVMDGGVKADDTSAGETSAPPVASRSDGRAADARLREADGSPRTAPAAPASVPASTRPDAAPASPSPEPEAAVAAAPAKARDTHAGVSSSASRRATGLVAQFLSAHGTPAPGAHPTSGGAVPPHAAANAPVPANVPVPAAAGTAPGTVPAIPVGTEGAETASVQGMDETAFGDPGGSGNPAHPGNSSTAGGSSHGAPAPAVSAAGQPGWTSWPAGQIPSSAAATLGHAAAADDPVVPQLVKALHVQLRNGVSEARVQLEPHHLGAVSVALRVENGVVSAVITAEQPAVRHWLEAHEASLRSALSEQGLQLNRLRVEPDGQQSGGRASTGEEPPPRRRMPRKETATFELVA